MPMIKEFGLNPGECSASLSLGPWRGALRAHVLLAARQAVTSKNLAALLTVRCDSRLCE